MSFHERAESVARDYFARRLQQYRIRHNRVLESTRYRPDFIVYGPESRTVVVECDESGHERYNQSDEIYREHCIAKSLHQMGFVPTILRFTPPGPESTRRLASQLAIVSEVISNILEGSTVNANRWVHIDDRRRLFTKIMVVVPSCERVNISTNYHT